MPSSNTSNDDTPHAPETPTVSITTPTDSAPTEDPPAEQATTSGTGTVPDPAAAVAASFDEPASDLESQTPPNKQCPFSYFGACILPVNQSEVKDKEGNSHDITFVLLGQDEKTGKLTVLGGRPDGADGGDPLKTAIRECYEETIGTFCDNLDRTYRDVTALGENVLHIEYVKTQLPYHIYVLPSELSNAMMGLFQDRRRALEKGHEMPQMAGYAKSCYMEKSKLVWVPMAAVKEHPKEVSWFTRQIVQAVLDECKARAPTEKEKSTTLESSSTGGT